MLSDLLSDRRTNGLDDNWTMVLGVLTANLNSFHGRQTASVPAYNAVFGANYHITTSCTVDEARKCNTVEDLQKVVMDDEGHINRFVLEHTEPTNTQPQNSDKYETEGRQYWEDDDDDTTTTTTTTITTTTLTMTMKWTSPKIMTISLAKWKMIMMMIRTIQRHQ